MVLVLYGILCENFDYDPEIDYYKTMSNKLLWFLFKISCVHKNKSTKCNCGSTSFIATEFYRDI